MYIGITSFDTEETRLELSPEDRRDLEDLEESLWRTETRFDNKLMDQTFSKDFFEFGRSGLVYGRQECLDVESQPIDARLPLEELRIRLISPDVAQVTYVSSVTYDGIEELANRSSDMDTRRTRMATTISSRDCHLQLISEFNWRRLGVSVRPATFHDYLKRTEVASFDEVAARLGRPGIQTQ